jgi:hypothetical protein
MTGHCVLFLRVSPLTLSLTLWERGRRCNRRDLVPLHPHSLANADTLRCQLAKASWTGEGWGEGCCP